LNTPYFRTQKNGIISALKITEMKENESDFDFRHHLYNTIILLGGKKEIAGLVKKSMDLGVL
jgi:hypothetical protein